MNQDISTRKLILNNELDRRQFREVLGSLLVSLVVSPQKDIWLVSPWLSDFDLLDNSSVSWSQIYPAWGNRIIRFSEMLLAMADTGNIVNLLTEENESSLKFSNALSVDSTKNLRLKVQSTDTMVHIKGMLTRDWLLSGSLNYTFSGTNRNDELDGLETDGSVISDVRSEFKRIYGCLFDE